MAPSQSYTQVPIRLEGQNIHSATVLCIDFLDEDRSIITCAEDGSIQVQEVATGRALDSSPWKDPGSGAIYAITLSENRTKLVTGCEDGRIRLWIIATRKMSGEWKKKHTRAILCVCWNPDESHIASGSEDGTAIIWDAKQGKIIGDPIRTGHQHVYTVCYSSDGATLMTSGCNNHVVFWDIKTRDSLHIVEACHASQQVHCITWTSDDRLFLGCSDGIVQMRTNAQEEDIRLVGRTGSICAIALSQDQSLLATASRDNTISLWDPKTNQSVGPHLQHPDGLRCAAFTRNSRLLAASGVDKNVYIWDLDPDGVPQSGVRVRNNFWACFWIWVSCLSESSADTDN
ncbi:WD40-repeat-containing domain protein [Suillus ampliporus]|nr:WD40-repeat-containing domain protein [Suillus ampliporus]